MNGYSAGIMNTRTLNTRTSVIYTYRSPWPRRLAVTAAILLLVAAGAAGYRLLQPADGAARIAHNGSR
jgi:hypothetical protein